LEGRKQVTILAIERRIRWSGILLSAGLGILVVSLIWNHPLSFMGFLALGCPLIVAGALLYLFALVSKDGSRTNSAAIIVLFILPLVVSGCGSSSPEDLVASKIASKVPNGPPPYDPASATVRIFGNIVMKGAPKAPPPLTIGDRFCRGNAKALWEAQALTAENGQVRDAIVFIKSGFEKRAYPIPSEPVVLDQQGCIYLPHMLTLMKGQKLRILNGDATFHNVHARHEAGDAFNIAQAQKGAEDFQTFNRSAIFHVGCDFHNWMSAYAGVFDHPFHTTARNGTYELRVPPGKYEVVAWHEKFGEQTFAIDATADRSVERNFEFSR
jgi:plastocyanin